MTGFREKTINGIAWSVVSKGGQQVLSLVLTVVLARLLTPEEFGLVAMVTVVTGFASLFAELGFGAALIQKQGIKEVHRSSVFWTNLAAGLALTGAFILAAPLIADFYDEPLLRLLTIVLAFNFTINALNIVQYMLMRKALDYRALAIMHIAATALSGVVAISMALTGWGVWCLVAQYVVERTTATALLWIMSDWRPRFLFDWGAMKELMRFSLSVLGDRTLNYWTRRLDNLLIGWKLGSEPLGLYSRAYALLLFPLANVTRVVMEVMFPSFTMIQDDPGRVKRIYLRVLRVVALFTFPMTVGLCVTAYPFVLTVFGPQWIGMVPIVRVLSLVAMIESVSKTIEAVYLSQGRAGLWFKVGIFTKVSAILGIVIGLQWGVVGVAVGYGVAALINVFPSLYFLRSIINIRFREVFGGLSKVFFLTLAMGAFVLVVGAAVPAAWPAWALLLVQVAVGSAFYLAAAHFLNVPAYEEARALVQEKLRPAPSRSANAKAAEQANAAPPPSAEAKSEAASHIVD